MVGQAADSERYKLSIPGFVNPALVKDLQRGSLSGIVADDGRHIVVEGYGQRLILRGEETLTPETEVSLSLGVNNHPYCKTKAQLDREAAERERKKREKERKRAEQRDQKRRDAEEFWMQYNIPFEFVVDIKGRRSGLLRTSNGTARDRRTVEHLIPKESISYGRLSRSADEYLCNPSATLPYSDGITRTDAESNTYIPPVTCQTCLNRMERWLVTEEE